VDHTALAILLALAASCCTATSSVCQRLGAAGLDRVTARDSTPRKRRPSAGGFDPLLVFRLATRPIWLLGFAGMLAGFAGQVTALHFGPLALVQPILAVELLFVFGYLVIRNATTLPGGGVPGSIAPASSGAQGNDPECRSPGGSGAGDGGAGADATGGGAPAGRPRAGRRHAVAWRDWLGAVAMSAGVAVFLTAASPSGGHSHAPAAAWWTAGLATVLVVSVAIAASRARLAPRVAGPGSATAAPAPTGGNASAAWRAACLGIATGISWGFVAAIIKELSGQVTGGPAAVFSTWPAYALMVTGAAAMLLTAHAMSAGPLAASQPGITIFDPVTATVLGVLLYSEQVRTTPLALAGEVVGLLALAVGARTLTRSTLLAPSAPIGAQESRRANQYGN
jgi:hypothetical protein